MSTKNQRCSFLSDLSISKILSHSGRRLGVNLARHWMSGNHHVLLNTTLNPSSYSDWKSFMEDYFATSFLKKYPWLNLNVDRRQVAIDSFWKSERRCTDVNLFLSKPANIPGHIWDLLERARSYIALILGEFSWDDALRFCDFGPGASVGVRRSHSHRVEKIGISKPTVTGQCLSLLNCYLQYDPHMADAIGDVTVVKGSKVTTVPKDAKKDRLIAIEPLWNMFFQKGIGGILRERLRRVGLSLNDQSVNQRLACEGSLNGRLATIDLSSASDCISKSLVEFLLPASWLNAMLSCRSEFTNIDGVDYALRKFSSMGNGFTFELESLIFLALGKACSPNSRVGHDLSVYGDDIIIPCDDSGNLIELLEVVGFTTNADKTFVSGPFRESCGKHYFHGRDVTPFFLRKKIDTQSDLLWLVNSLKRYAFRLMGSYYGLDSSVREVYDDLVGKLPSRISSLSIPEGYGDVAVLRDLDEALPHTVVHTPYGIEGYSTFVLLTRFKNKRFSGLPCLVHKLWFTRFHGVNSAVESSGYDLLKPIAVKQRIRRIVVRRWSTLGPWV